MYKRYRTTVRIKGMIWYESMQSKYFWNILLMTSLMHYYIDNYKLDDRNINYTIREKDEVGYLCTAWKHLMWRLISRNVIQNILDLKNEVFYPWYGAGWWGIGLWIGAGWYFGPWTGAWGAGP